MTNALGTYNEATFRKMLDMYRSGARRIGMKGSRRSGKTWSIAQRELQNALQYNAVVNVATMTNEQGRLGVFADCCDIIKGTERLNEYLRVYSSPREIRCLSGGRLFFNSYQNAETAKGIACDDAFLNEANNFSLKQVQDIIASVRDLVILDYNQSPEWIDKIVPPECVIKTTWKDNAYLTEAQKQYFYDLKRNAESPKATAMDVWLYRVYYLGEDAELSGDIFTPENIPTIKEAPTGCGHILAFADPSAMRGADYFAMVLGCTDGKNIYILDSFSENDGRPKITCWNKLEEWRTKWDLESVYVEVNGAGVEFYEFLVNSNFPCASWCSRGNKFQRITDNYQPLTNRVVWTETEPNKAYLQQVFEFGQKCLHDDNIDAANSLYMLYKTLRLID